MNHDEAYSLAVYLRDMLQNEPDTEDVTVFIEHTSEGGEKPRKLVRATVLIPYEGD